MISNQAIESAADAHIVIRERDDELSVEEVVAQARKVQEVMKALMKSGEHYGVIPGTGGKDGKDAKPTLLKAGAEKLCLLFRLDPQYSHVERWDGPHLSIVSTCTLYHIPTGQRRGSGMGSCSTRESKYAYRKGSRKCPECDAEAIIKGKAEYGGGWLCFAKKGGCGAKFKEDDASITSQEDGGRVANDDLPDVYNTVLKMANKRSLVAAVLNVTAASDIFTQDLEDLQPTQPQESRAPQQSRGPASTPGAARMSEVRDQINHARTLDDLRAIWPNIVELKKKKLVPPSEYNALLADHAARKEAIEEFEHDLAQRGEVSDESVIP